MKKKATKPSVHWTKKIIERKVVREGEPFKLKPQGHMELIREKEHG
jgi:hypothetical protein